MDTLFLILKKGLVATICVVFAFVLTYVPIAPTSHVEQAEAAGAATGISTSLGQAIQNGSALAGNAVNTLTAGATGSLWAKENVLDGIGWAIAKRIVSGMVSDLINWINSGFQGSPAFVTDLGGFLRNIADQEIGRVISELGDVGSFICSPFRLDVQISIAVQYNQARTTGQSAPTCTLSGVIDNIEGFISGIDPGNGISDWLTITSAPQTYTPYGAQLNAEAIARARLINAQGEEVQLLNWGDGFLSQEVCEADGAGGESCSIVKPGTMIANQLNKALGAGQDTLVQADELNELVSALLGQLANKAVSGVNGLLGLSGGSDFSYSDYDGSYLNELQSEADGIVVGGGGIAQETIDQSLSLTRDYRNTARSYQADLLAFSQDVSNSQADRNQALLLSQEIGLEVTDSNADIALLVEWQIEYPTATTDRQVEILIEYTSLNLPSESQMSRNLSRWQREALALDVTLN